MSCPTPLVARYLKAKAVVPNELLLLRFGDFYEVLFDDAPIMARALGIALTKRGTHNGEPIPMCGVPVHSADDCVAKLVGMGYRVAACDPALGSGVRSNVVGLSAAHLTGVCVPFLAGDGA